jgi:hypothetical protein
VTYSHSDPRHGLEPLGMVVKRKTADESTTKWIQCDQCDQWRESSEKFQDSSFLCHFLFPWEEKDANGRFAGGCNTEADQFDAFDTTDLDEELSVDFIRSCIKNLLDKLPKNFSEMSKEEMVDKLNRCANDNDLMEQVRFLLGLRILIFSMKHALLSIRSLQFFTCAFTDEGACSPNIYANQNEHE